MYSGIPRIEVSYSAYSIAKGLVKVQKKGGMKLRKNDCETDKNMVQST